MWKGTNTDTQVPSNTPTEREEEEVEGQMGTEIFLIFSIMIIKCLKDIILWKFKGSVGS